MNSDLLQLLASGGGYLDDEKTEPTIFELDVDEVLSQVSSSLFLLEYYMDATDQVFENMLDGVADAKQLLDGRHKKSTEEFSGVVLYISCLEVNGLKQQEQYGIGSTLTVTIFVPANLNVHEGLLQKLDLGSVYMDNKKTKSTIDLVGDKVLIHNGGLSLFLEQSMDATFSLQRSHFGTDILEEVGETFCQDTIGIADMLYNLELHSNLLERSVWGYDLDGKRGTNLLAIITTSDIFDDLPDGQKLNCTNGNMIICEGMQRVKGLQLVYAELQPWKHSVFSIGMISMKAYCLVLGNTQLWACGGFSQGSNATHCAQENTNQKGKSNSVGRFSATLLPLT